MEALTSSGWRINEEKLTSLLQQENQDEEKAQNGARKKPKRSLKELSLSVDLKDVGLAWLADKVAEATASDDRVLGLGAQGAVLQLSRLRNVSAPKANEESGAAPRMLKLSLSDGHSTVHAIEVKPLEKISLSTPPGTKIKLKGRPVLKGGFLMLEPANLEVLGGKVEALVDKWEISRKLATFTRAKTTGRDGGPPPWVSFGKKIGVMPSEKESKEDTKKAVAAPKVVAEGDEEEEGEGDKEFNAQRKGAIEEAAKQGGRKVFGGGNKEIKEGSKRRGGGGDRRGGNRNDEERVAGLLVTRLPEPGAPRASGEREQDPRDRNRDRAGPSDYEDRGRGGRGGRRGGRGGRRDRDDDDEEAGGGYSKPSQGVSLFDFLEEKFPGAHDVPEETSTSARPKGGSRDQYHEREHEHEQYNGSRGGRGGDRGGDRGGRRGTGGDRRDHRDGGGRGGRSDHNRDDHQRGGRRHEDGGGRDQRGGDRGGDRNNGGRGGGRDQRDNRRPQHQQQLGAQFRQQRENTNNYQSREQQPPPRRDPRQARGGGAHNDRKPMQGGEQRDNRGGDARGTRKGGSDRDFGEWSNSTYLETQQTSGGGGGNRRGGGGDRDHGDSRRQQNNYGNKDSSTWTPSDFQNLSLEPPRQQQSSSGGNNHNNNGRAVNGGGSKWHVGDACQAKYWEDGQFYPVKVTALSKSTAVVLFQEYGNHEEVMLSDLRAARSSKEKQPIPATPGLPPAFAQS